jgi:hypothetical protein
MGQNKKIWQIEGLAITFAAVLYNTYQERQRDMAR